jgi:transposase
MIPAPPLVGIELNPGPALTEEQRAEIVTLHNVAHYSIGKIIKTTGYSKNTIKRALKKNKEKKSLKNEPGQGRKRKIGPQLLKRMKRKAKRKKPATKIAHEITAEIPGGISERSVRRYLKESYEYLVIEKREALTPAQEQKRLSFARRRKNHDWEYEVFVDEKTWELRSTIDKCWQDPKNRLTETKKRHAAKIHCWGGIGKHFKTKLYFFKQNLNSKLYCKILKSRLPPEYKYDLDHLHYGNWILVQDNDPKHKSKTTTTLLDKLAPNRLTDWPANSPDFNPIEDVWSMLQSAIKYKKISNLTSLQKHLTKAWNDLDITVIQRSVNSLPARFKQCIERKGKRTDY